MAVRMSTFPRMVHRYNAENRKKRAVSRPPVSGKPSRMNLVTRVRFLIFESVLGVCKNKFVAELNMLQKLTVSASVKW